jgi:hypothetical protein
MADLELTPERNRIYRITHIRNVPWILEHGLHCRSSTTIDPNFVSIGSADLITKRSGHEIPIEPRGTLADYVPFYFTPHSMMLLNIKTGYNGIARQPNSSIVILVSSFDKLVESGCQAIFTDGHAYMQGTTYYRERTDLDKIDWDILQHRDFRRSEDLDKSRRYMAEALVHKHVPISALLGLVCYDQGSKQAVMADVERLDLDLPVRALPSHFFP